MPGSSWHGPCQDHCVGLSAACAMHQVGMGSQGNKQLEEWCIWNGMVHPMHGFMTVSFENQALLGAA